MSNLKLICNNPSCINKSIVYRKETHNGFNYECKKCGYPLEKVANKKYIKQDNKAKVELKESNNGYY